MIFKYIDRSIDNAYAKLFTKLRKIGRRIERTHRTTYEHWLTYCARRSKDLSVKATLWLVSYCFLTLARSIYDLYWYTGIYRFKGLVSIGYLDHQLDLFNKTKVARSGVNVFDNDLRFQKPGQDQIFIYYKYWEERNK